MFFTYIYVVLKYTYTYISGVLYSFLWVIFGNWRHFPSKGFPFGISNSIGLPLINTSSFYISEKMILPQIFKDIFSKYRILSWQFLFHTHKKRFNLYFLNNNVSIFWMALIFFITKYLRQASYEEDGLFSSQFLEVISPNITEDHYAVCHTSLVLQHWRPLFWCILLLPHSRQLLIYYVFLHKLNYMISCHFF